MANHETDPTRQPGSRTVDVRPNPPIIPAPTNPRFRPALEATAEPKDRPTELDFSDSGDALDFHEGAIAGLQMVLKQTASEEPPTQPEAQ